MIKRNFLILQIISFSLMIQFPCYGVNLEKGKTLFLINCIACHQNGNNLIIPEKNLKKSTLEANGMYNQNAIIYQVLNGKNGMPAFGGRLNENEIENIASYILYAANKEFEE